MDCTLGSLVGVGSWWWVEKNAWGSLLSCTMLLKPRLIIEY